MKFLSIALIAIAIVGSLAQPGDGNPPHEGGEGHPQRPPRGKRLCDLITFQNQDVSVEDCLSILEQIHESCEATVVVDDAAEEDMDTRHLVRECVHEEMQLKFDFISLREMSIEQRTLYVAQQCSAVNEDGEPMHGDVAACETTFTEVIDGCIESSEDDFQFHGCLRRAFHDRHHGNGQGPPPRGDGPPPQDGQGPPRRGDGPPPQDGQGRPQRGEGEGRPQRGEGEGRPQRGEGEGRPQRGGPHHGRPDEQWRRGDEEESSSEEDSREHEGRRGRQHRGPPGRRHHPRGGRHGREPEEPMPVDGVSILPGEMEPVDEQPRMEKPYFGEDGQGQGPENDDGNEVARKGPRGGRGGRREHATGAADSSLLLEDGDRRRVPRRHDLSAVKSLSEMKRMMADENGNVSRLSERSRFRGSRKAAGRRPRRN